MAKYSYEIKQRVVQEYLNGEGSYEYLANKHNIPSHTPIREWVAAYKAMGKEGLLRSRKNKRYSLQFKLFVVELYLTSEVSYQELAISQGINNPALVRKWVNDYRATGPDALKPKKRGRKKTVDTNETKQSAEIDSETSVDTSAEHIKALEEENLKLRIENAYLKELRRLRLEEEKLLKARRE